MTTENTKVTFHDLAKRQFDNNAPFTSWTCSNEEIINRVGQSIDARDYKKGNVEGSMLVRISHDSIYTPVVELEDGQKLVGVYEPRRGTTYSIKSINAVPLDGQKKLPAKYCEVIVYPNPNEDQSGSYVIVSVNGSPTEEETPINPMTLLRNYFMIGAEQSHGTNVTWSELEITLHNALEYWENKAMLG